MYINIIFYSFLFFLFAIGDKVLAYKGKNQEELLVPQNKIQTSRRSIKESFLVGIGAGAIETFTNHPLWVWKTRAQYGDYFTINPRVIYKGVFSRVVAMSHITATRVILRDSILRNGFNEDTPSFIQNAFASFLGGAFSAPLSSSLELILTQQQVNLKKNEFSSFRSSFFAMRNLGGVKVFSTGLPCSMMRDGIINTSFLCFTPYIKHYLDEDRHEKKNNRIIISLTAGILSGVIAAILSNPFDTIKSIQQSEALINPKDRKTVIKVSSDLWKNEGLQGFCKGFFWRGARLITGVPILFYSSEIFTNIYNEQSYNKENFE